MSEAQNHALSGYCLWLVPPPDQSKSLSSLISTLSHSATNLTGVKSPTFQPHVTLFSPRSDVRADVDEMKRRTQRALEIYSKGSAGERRGDQSGDVTLVGCAPDVAPDGAASAPGSVSGSSGGNGSRSRGQGGIEIVLNNPTLGQKYYQCVLSPVDEAEGRGVQLERLRAACLEAFGEDQPFYFPHLSLTYGELTEDQRWQIVDEAHSATEWPKKSFFNEVVLVDINGVADQWRVVERYRL